MNRQIGIQARFYASRPGKPRFLSKTCWCMQALVNGMTLEERGIKREHSTACTGGDPSAEHSAKRARTFAPQPHLPASLAPLPQHAAYGQPSYDPYGNLYQTPPPVQHPYGQQLPVQSSQWGVSPGQHWPPQQPPQQPGQQGVPVYFPPSVLHPTYTPLPASPAQTVPHHAAPVQPLQQLPSGYPDGQLGSNFQATAYANYIGSYQQSQQPATAPAPSLYQYAVSRAFTPQQQQQQQYDSMQWAVHSMQFQSIVEEPPPPPPPG